MSDYIEEKLKSTADAHGASSAMRNRLEHHRRVRLTRARTFSGAGLAALTVLAVIAAPRSSSASEVYAEVSNAFRNGYAFRMTMYKNYEGDPERVAMDQTVHRGGFISTFFKDSVMEFTMREDDNEIVMYYPRLNLAQRPEKSGENWRESAPRADEDLLAYVQRRLVNDMSDALNPAPLKPLRIVSGQLMDGRRTVRLDFEDLASTDTKRTYALFADEATKQPVLLRSKIVRNVRGHVRTLHTTCTFESVADLANIPASVPPPGVPVVDMVSFQENLRGKADISPLFGGVRLALRGPHESLLLVTKHKILNVTEGWKSKPVDLAGFTWLPIMSMSGELGDEQSPWAYVTTLIPVDETESSVYPVTLPPAKSEDIAFTSLPFPVIGKAGSWGEEAGGLLSGRTLAKEYSESSMARANYYRDRKNPSKAKEILLEAAKHKELLIPGVDVIFREELAEIEKEIQR